MLILLSQPTGANAVVEMELKAGLSGWAVSGLATEMKIRLFATSPISGRVEILQSGGLTTLPVQLDEHREETWWLQVNPDAGRPIRIRLITKQGQVIEKEQAFEHSRTPLTIISSSIVAGDEFSGHQQSSRILPLILPATGMPHIAQAYAGVGAVVSDSQSLSKLEQDQYHALSRYLGRCGILLVADADAAVLERLRDISGCGGRFVNTYQNLSAVTALLLRLDAERPMAAPAPQELMSLQQTVFQQRMITTLSFYLGGYLVFITLMTWRMKRSRSLLLLPVLVAGAGVLAWSGAGGQQLITWAQAQSGDRYSRVASVLLLGGDRRGHSSATIGPDTGISRLGGNSSQAVIRYQHDGRERVLSADTDLLSPLACELTSVARQPLPFSLTLRDGHPQVMLQTDSFPDQARLLWRGRVYSVPKLKKGDPWQPLEAAANAPESAPERLLNRRLAFGDPALLLPFSPGTNDAGGAGARATGWLAIRHDPRRL